VIADKHAVNNTLIVMAIDKLLWPRFGRSWIASVRAAGIRNWLVAALDADTSLALGQFGAEDQCFNAPLKGPGGLIGAAFDSPA
jgi:hypothetical protein